MSDSWVSGSDPEQTRFAPSFVTVQAVAEQKRAELQAAIRELEAEWAADERKLAERSRRAERNFWILMALAIVAIAVGVGACVGWLWR